MKATAGSAREGRMAKHLDLLGASVAVLTVLLGSPAGAQSAPQVAEAQPIGQVTPEQSASRQTAVSGQPVPGEAAPGQTASDQRLAAEIGDIVVTASRREETLSRVPISVAAYNQESLDQRGIRSVNDISRITTGISLLQNSPVKGFNIAIRGVDSRVGAGTVGIYIDETPIQVRRLGSFAQNIYPQLFDLERVEILRGPQGTLFGAGSQGGTVRFITPQPDYDRYSVYARGELASTENGAESYEAGAAVGIPLIADRLALRLSGFYRRDGGWVDRVDPDSGATVEKDTNRLTTYALRGALSVAVTEALTVTPSVFYQRRRVNNSDQFWNVRSFLPAAAGPVQPAATFTVPFSNRRQGEFVNGDPQAQPGTEEFLLGSLKVEAEIGSVTAIANGSYFDSDSVYRFDFSTPVPIVVTRGAVQRIAGFTAANDQVDRQKNYTAELRLQPTTPNERLNWLVGVFYAHQRQTAFGGITGTNNDFLFRALTGNPNADADLILGAPNVQPGDYALVADNASLDEQIAGFGELSYNLTPELKLTAGLRVSRTKVEFTNISEGPFSGPRAISNSDARSTPVTPKFNVSYQADPNNLFYATAAKGFRVGGGNAQLPAALCGADVAAIGLDRTPDSYDPDELWSYEVGSKNKLLNRRLTIDASAYLIKWDSLQQQVFLPCQFFYVANAGKAQSKGFDLSLSMQPSDNIFFNASVGYLDAEYTQTVFPGPIPGTGPRSVIVSDGDVIDNPPWTVSLNARLEQPIGDAEGYLNADFIHRSRNKGQSPVQNPLSVAFEGYPTIEATNQLNLRLGATFGSIDASLFVNNLTNDFPLVYYRQDFPGSPLFKNVSLRPRTFGLTVAVRQ